jgi:DTW domain-containing protein YfiP
MVIILKDGTWEELKNRLRIKFPQLTEADLQHDEGKEEGMLRMVEYKLRKTKKEMREIIAGLYSVSPINNN